MAEKRKGVFATTDEWVGVSRQVADEDYFQQPLEFFLLRNSVFYTFRIINGSFQRLPGVLLKIIHTHTAGTKVTGDDFSVLPLFFHFLKVPFLAFTSLGAWKTSSYPFKCLFCITLI